jgi:uncharacterized protein YdeI (YjbR/CyaY-like superfamily)
MNPKADWFFNKAEKWKDEYEILRKICFDSGLTEELKRGYLLHFSGAKQSKTRVRKVEKCIPKILNGMGLQD